MTPQAFPEQNVIFAVNQPPYLPLGAYRAGDANGRVVFCWGLTWRERFHVLFTGRIWHSVLTFYGPLQPQRLQTTKPEM